MIVKSIKHLKKVIRKLEAAKVFAIDFETYGVRERENEDLGKKLALILNRARINSISIATDKQDWCIILDTFEPDYKYKLDSLKALDILKPVLENKKIKKVMHHANYDYNVAANHGIKMRNIYCTMLASGVHDVNLGKGLKGRAAMVGMLLHSIASLKNPDEWVEYASEDAVATIRLYQAYEFGAIKGNEDGNIASITQVKKMKLEKWQSDHLYNVEFPILKVCLGMERRGMKVDFKYLEKLEKRLKKKKEELLTRIFSYADEPFNMNSNKQMSVFLYSHLKIEPYKVSEKTGEPSSDSESLFFLRDRHPVMPLISKVRTIDKLLGTYANTTKGLAAYSDPKGFIHATINSMGAVTFRFSVQNPPLQTLPREATIKDDLGDGFSVRAGFIPSKKNHVLIGCDYTQMELVMLAIYTRDPLFVKLMRHDCDKHPEECVFMTRDGENVCISGDIHQKTADACNVSRQAAKPINFGLVYGMGYKRLAHTLTISGIPTTDLQAKKIWKLFHATYKQVRVYHDWAVAEHKRKGYVEHLSGRRRSIPGINSKAGDKFWSAKLELINNIVQGSCVDWVKNSMLLISRDSWMKEHKVKMLMQVHDELIFDCPKLYAEEALVRVKKFMTTPPENCIKELIVPMRASGSIGNSWKETK